MEGGKEHRFWTQVVGSEQVRIGDEFVGFLRSVSGGHVFLEWDGAKYPVYLDGPEGERTVNLRLRKQKYMKGTALQGFKNLVRIEAGAEPAAKLEEKLKGTKGIEEVIPVKELRERIPEIIRGEEPSFSCYRAVNTAMVAAYWHVGRLIVEHEQGGASRARYGGAVITDLATRLTRDFSRGFDERNLWYMRSFFLAFPILNAARSESSATGHGRRGGHSPGSQARQPAPGPGAWTSAA
jgi:hypothetical protein